MVNLSINQNGTWLPLNSRKPLRAISKAQYTHSLLAEDTLALTLESIEPITFHLGDYLHHENRRYTLNTAPKVRREQGIFTYELTFEGIRYDLRNKIFFNLDEQGFQTSPEFSLTGAIDAFLRVLCTNINSISQTAWTLGEFPQDSDTKTLTFSNENCLAVLQKICQEYDQEFHIVEDATNRSCVLHIKKIGKTIPHAFQYGRGNGLYSLTRSNATETITTRLYAYGSSENLPIGYRNYSDRLRLPSAHGTDYIEDAEKVSLFGLIESVKTFDEIKPSFTGKISAVGTFDDFLKVQYLECTAMDFDLNASANGSTLYLIDGTTARLHFNTGKLAGYDFELKNYNHATKMFGVKQYTDERGQAFPDLNTQAFRFSVGDEFTILDIRMPEQYIINAENKLLQDAQKEYAKLATNNLQYTLEVDPQFLDGITGGSDYFAVGDYLHIVDELLQVDKTSRITSLTRDLLKENSYNLTIADTHEVSIIANIINDIKDTQTVIKTQNETNREGVRRGYRRLEELRESIFDTDGYFDPQHIKPASIETNMLSIGAKSQQFALEGVTLTPNYQSNTNSIRITGGKLVHFSISNTIREWNISELQRDITADSVYFVYCRCSRTGLGASWYVTTAKIKFDERPSHYYFLCFVISSPIDGKRTAEAMYGNVMMHGGQISAGRIQSIDGGTYFDLDNGEIGGNIKFKNNNGQLTGIDNAINEAIDNINIGGRNLLFDSNFKNVTGLENYLCYVNKVSQYEGELLIGNTAIEIRAKNGNDNYTENAFRRKLKPNTTYTFSYWAKSAGAITGSSSYIFLGGRIVFIEEFPTPYTGYQRSSKTFTTDATNVDFSVRFGFGQNGDAWFLVNAVKLEEGTIATDWTPAPEDTQTSISQSLETAKAFARGLTQIQAQNIQALENKTNFLTETAISGNVVATGSMIVGNHYGANAGLTGLGGNSDVFLWGGANFESRDIAPISISRDGYLRVRDAQGRLVFQIGQRDGKAVFDIFDENGNRVANIGQQGIMFTGYIAESYTQQEFYKLNADWNDDTAIRNELSGNFTKTQISGASPRTPDNDWVSVRVSLTTNTTAYLYSEGRNFESAGNAQYAGYYKSKNKLDPSQRMNGIYAVKSEIDVLQGYQNNHYHNGEYTLSVALYRIENGVVKSVKTLPFSGNVNSHL